MNEDERTRRNLGSMQDFNNAVLAIRQGDRRSALVYYQNALNLLGEELVQDDRAFKAIVAYQYGVCLMKLYELDEEPNLSNLSGARHEAAEKIRALWWETIRLYQTLDKQTVDHYAEQFPPGLSQAFDSIKRDRLMHTGTGSLKEFAQQQLARNASAKSKSGCLSLVCLIVAVIVVTMLGMLGLK